MPAVIWHNAGAAGEKGKQASISHVENFSEADLIFLSLTLL